jgi:hypothetical protein
VGLASLDGQVLERYPERRTWSADDLKWPIFQRTGVDHRLTLSRPEDGQGLGRDASGGVSDKQAAIDGVGEGVSALRQKDGVAWVTVTVCLQNGVAQAFAVGRVVRGTGQRCEGGRGETVFQLFQPGPVGAMAFWHWKPLQARHRIDSQ